MNIEREIADLKRRLDAGDRGEFAGYTKELIDSFKDFKTKVDDLYLDYERRQRWRKGWRPTLTWTLGTITTLMVIRNSIELLSK